MLYPTKVIEEAQEKIEEAQEMMEEAHELIQRVENIKIKVKVGFGIFFFVVSIFVNILQFYLLWEHRLPTASYVSFVGVNERGYCVTGQEFLNYNPDSKAAIQNTIKAIETFQNINRVVLTNKWIISNDMSEPPHIKVVYKDGKKVFKNEF
jgi:hypothetical protein